jgi:very-short-patch-repair endonuclease
LLWLKLRGRRLDGYKFRRQVSISRFVVDFAALEAKLIVEVDGGQHALEREKDAARTEELERFGFRVVRFWNHEVLSNIEGVLEVVLQELRLVH